MREKRTIKSKILTKIEGTFLPLLFSSWRVNELTSFPLDWIKSEEID